MEEIKARLTDSQRAIKRVKVFQMIALVFSAITLAIALFFFIYAFTRPRVKSTKNDSVAVQQLSKNNAMLIKTVEDLTASTKEKKRQDSLYAVQVQKNNDFLSKSNDRLTKIDNIYDKSINAVSTYDDAQLANYISIEAARIRQGNGAR